MAGSRARAGGICGVEMAMWDLAGKAGIEKPIANHAFIAMPEKPGLGIKLNDAAMKEHLMPDSGGYFETT